MVSKSQVIQIPAVHSNATDGSSIRLPSDLSTSVNIPPSSASKISPASSVVSLRTGGSISPTPVSSTSPQIKTQQSPSQTSSSSASGRTPKPPLSPPPEVKQQQEGMTTPSNANQILLQFEPCNVDGLPTKRLKDQAEGMMTSFYCYECSFTIENKLKII